MSQKKDALERVSFSLMNDPAPSGPINSDPEPSIDEARLRQQAIGVKLRQMFDEIVNEPVPQDFLEILRRADDKKSLGGQD
jgi:hypothetical protein